MDSGDKRNLDYLYCDLLEQDSFVSPARSESETSVDIYDGLDISHNGGGLSTSYEAAGENTPARDCFDLYEEILTEEGTAKETSFKEFQKKFLEREKQVGELMKKMQELQTQNSTLANENIQLKKNMSALIKTARLEVVRKDEEINRLNRRESMNWIGQRSHSNLPPGSFNVPALPRTAKNAHPGKVRPCPSRPGNVEPSPAIACLNKVGKCLPTELHKAQTNISESKRQWCLRKSISSLSNPELPPCGDLPLRPPAHQDNVPPRLKTPGVDTMGPFPFEARVVVEKINIPNSEKYANVEKANGCIGKFPTLPSVGNNNKEVDTLAKIDKAEQPCQRTKLQSEMKDLIRRNPEKRDQIGNHFSQDTSKGSPEMRDKRTSEEKEGKHKLREERHKDKEAKRRDAREKELRTDRKKDWQSDQEDSKNKPRDNRARSRLLEKEREPEKRRSEKTREWLKRVSPLSLRKSSRGVVSTDREHTSKERRERKVTSEKSRKEIRNPKGDRDQKSKCSNRNERGTASTNENSKRSVRNDRNLKRDKNKQKKDKCEQKEDKCERKDDRRDHSHGGLCTRDGKDVARRETEQRGGKDKTRLVDISEDMSEESQAVDSKNERSHVNRADNLQTPAIAQSLSKATDPKLQFMETLQLTVSPVKQLLSVPCKVSLEKQCSPEAGGEEASEINTCLSEEPSFNSEQLFETVEEIEAEESFCQAVESPVGTSKVQTSQTDLKGAKLEIPSDSQPEQDEEEEENDPKVVLEESVPLWTVISECSADDPETLTQVVVETIGTVEVTSEELSPVNGNAEVVMDRGQAQPIKQPEWIDYDDCGEVAEKLEHFTEMDLVPASIERELGESLEQPAEINNNVANGKLEASNTCLDVRGLVAEEWAQNIEPDSTSCEPQQANICVEVVSAAVTKMPVKSDYVPYEQEENSIQSIDFNYIGHIPYPISPLTSPLRPIKPVALESLCAPPPINLEHKDSEPELQEGNDTRSCALELNKENCQPVGNLGGKASTKESLCEELEEGEIISDEEECASPTQKSGCNIQAPKGNDSQEKSKPNNNLPKKKRSMNYEKPTAKLIVKCSPTKYSTKTKDAIRGDQSDKMNSKLSDQKSERPKSLASPGSSVERNRVKSAASVLMESLMVTRKNIRKRYMKLHKQFEIRSFQRIIEIAFADFTTIVKQTDFPQSRQHLKSSICVAIETMLSRVKCNGIVSSIFSQQAPNMKEKLWIFVEKQLDYMFNKVRETFISCHSINLELTLEEKKKSERIGRKRKRDTILEHLKKKLECKLPNPQVSNSSSESFVKHNIPNKKNSGKTKPVNEHIKGKGGEVVKKYSKNYMDISGDGAIKRGESKVCSSKVPNGLSVANANTPSNAQIVLSSTKESHDRAELGILTEQQASTLTFNLVSDAQMGEIFKCLLQGADFLDQGMDQGTLECNSWPTPEKVISANAMQDLAGIDSTPDKTPMLSQGDSLSWAPVTPDKHEVAIRPPLNPDILDESCMMEIPREVEQAKGDTAVNLQEDYDGQKIPENSCMRQVQSSLSTILMEDLAVSLTVPSPLKSDRQISFLTSQDAAALCDVRTDAILSANYCENTIVEEEDASEQDIHLTLDSENSSSGSSSSSTWNNPLPSSALQHSLHPPMQAVIMEKSNDHFIVKIRCRPPSLTGAQQGSPVLALMKEDQGAETEESAGCGSETVGEEVVVPCRDVEAVHRDWQDPLEQPQELPGLSSTDGMHEPELGSDAGAKSPGSYKQSVSETEDHKGPEVQGKPCDKLKEAAEVVTLSPGDVTVVVPLDDCGSDNRKRKNSEKVDSVAKKSRKEDELSKSNKKTRKAKDISSKRNSGKRSLHKAAITPEKNVNGSSQSSGLSPTSLPAKNVIKKNGEVVVTWTRENDRNILLDCQQKGANERTFSYLATSLDRSSRQVSERFYRLMKLFKKSEYMNS